MKDKPFKFRPRKSIDGRHGVKNGTRAEWAEKALLVFREECGYPKQDDNECPIMDLIGDLLHLADRDGLDADHLLRNGRIMWEDER
jgi:hypothetical protein